MCGGRYLPATDRIGPLRSYEYGTGTIPGDPAAWPHILEAVADADESAVELACRLWISDQPGSDEARLRWAAGIGGEYAEFVRVQCELAADPWLSQFPADSRNCLDMYLDPQNHGDQDQKHRINALKRRERELWNASRLNGAPHPWFGTMAWPRIRSNWLSSHNEPVMTIRPKGGTVVIRLVRGLPGELTLSSAAWLGGESQTWNPDYEEPQPAGRTPGLWESVYWNHRDGRRVTCGECEGMSENDDPNGTYLGSSGGRYVNKRAEHYRQLRRQLCENCAGVGTLPRTPPAGWLPGLERVVLTTMPEMERVSESTLGPVYRISGLTKTRPSPPGEALRIAALVLFKAEFPGLHFELPGAVPADPEPIEETSNRGHRRIRRR